MTDSQEAGDQAQGYHAGELVPCHFDTFRSLATSYANAQRGAPVVEASLFQNPTRDHVRAWIISTEFLRLGDREQSALIEKAEFKGRGVITLGRVQEEGSSTVFRLIVWDKDKRKTHQKTVPTSIVAGAIAADSSPLCAALANDLEFLLAAASTLSPEWRLATVEADELDAVSTQVQSGKKVSG